MKKFWNLIVMVMLVLGVLPMTGCGVDDAKQTVNNVTETVNQTASDTKETISWWTRSTDHQSWVNPTGTKVEIVERRKEGDFKITIVYPVDVLNQDNREKVRPTGDATITIYADSISEELMEELQSY